jgi:hypothetical protein
MTGRSGGPLSAKRIAEIGREIERNRGLEDAYQAAKRAKPPTWVKEGITAFEWYEREKKRRGA